MKIKLWAVIALTAIAGVNAYFAAPSNDAESELLLCNVESLADVEYNNFFLWFSQGITMDEREWKRPCPENYANSNSGSVSGGNGQVGGSISGSSSTSYSGAYGRQEIRCPYGSTNCTEITCD